MKKKSQRNEPVKNVLIVGAGGFAGGFLVEEALRRGHKVWAGLRSTTSRRWLGDPAINFVELDFDNPASLAPTLGQAAPEGGWDWIVYNLGATKCLSFSDFSKINCDYLRHFTGALEESGTVPEKLLYMSSLSALGPGDEKNGTPLAESKVPVPNTRYGASKLKAEMHLAMSGIPHIVFRPTGIYGPRDPDYFLMFESIAKGWNFSVGYKSQKLSFIYVEDLARAVFDALEKAPAGETYHIAEPHTYTQKEFRRLASKVLGRKHVVSVALPLFAVKAVSAVAEKWGVARMKPSTLNRDKFNILKQRNWSVDVRKAERDFGFRPEVGLHEGIIRSVEWYRKEGWL